MRLLCVTNSRKVYQQRFFRTLHWPRKGSRNHFSWNRLIAQPHHIERSEYLSA